MNLRKNHVDTTSSAVTEFRDVNNLCPSGDLAMRNCPDFLFRSVEFGQIRSQYHG